MCNAELQISKLIPIYTSVENHKKRFESIPKRPQPNMPNFRNNNRRNGANANNFQFFFNGLPVHSFTNFFGSIFGRNNANNNNNNGNTRRRSLFRTGMNFLPIILFFLLPTAIEILLAILNFFIRLMFGTLLESEFFPYDEYIQTNYRPHANRGNYRANRGQHSESSANYSNMYSNANNDLISNGEGGSLAGFLLSNLGWILILGVNLILNRGVLRRFFGEAKRVLVRGFRRVRAMGEGLWRRGQNQNQNQNRNGNGGNTVPNANGVPGQNPGGNVAQ